MASWVKCTTVDGTEVRLNMDHVALVRPYREDRGGTGSEVIFAARAAQLNRCEGRSRVSDRASTPPRTRNRPSRCNLAGVT